MSAPIAIIGAMFVELEAVLADVEDPVPTVIAGRTFVRGMLHGHDVILVVSRIGKVAAATTATILVERFGARALVFTGVAGGVSPDLQIGDLVVADRLIQHDLDARPLFPRWEVPLLGITHFALEVAWIEHSLAAAQRAVATPEIASALTLLELGMPRPPRAHRGLIVSGDQFLGSTQAVSALRADLPDALAVEMEGAAVAQVAYEYGVPCVVVRAISDTADHSATVDYSRFLSAVLAPYSRSVVRAMFATPLPRLG